jgi:hypothetical protein
VGLVFQVARARQVRREAREIQVDLERPLDSDPPMVRRAVEDFVRRESGR